MPSACGEEQTASELAGAGESSVHQDRPQGGVKSAQAAGPSDGGAQAAGRRRVSSYPVLLGADGGDGGQDPALDPVMRDEQHSASSSGRAEVANVTAAARHAGARAADSAGGGLGAPLQAAGRSSSTPQPSGIGGLAQSLPPLLDSPARGPFSELQRSEAADSRPERAVELIPARSSGEFHGADAADGRPRAWASKGLAVVGSTPGVVQEGAVFADVEGVGPLRVCGAEAHSRRQQDYYAATVAVDVLSFLYVAINYQARQRGTSSCRMLDDDQMPALVERITIKTRFKAKIVLLPIKSLMNVQEDVQGLYNQHFAMRVPMA